MEFAIIIFYLFLTLILFSYNCAQLTLVLNYWRKKSQNIKEQNSLSGKIVEYPFVTIQLPIYNERYVVERLIDAVAGFDYPYKQFEIQILDDSTDETVEIIAQKVAYYQSKGLQIHHIRRANRAGFKAGALAYGLESARGEFIAIFDADFVPQSDFLKKTMPSFSNEKVGVVQTRWGHLNQSYSILTQLQAFGLDGHFIVEQGGRNANGHFINFNGTAGIWRKGCITDAGGWEADTLTEDLDLSYRAQTRGWQFVYLEQVETPAELPVTMPALKSQQYRWMKGAAECARKNLINVFRTNSLKLSTKIHAAFHLLNSGIFVVLILMALISLPALFILHQSSEYSYLLGIFRLFPASLFILLIFYWAAHYRRKPILQLIWQMPVFLTVIMGLSLHNATAAIEGYFGKKTPFVRTPKWGIVKQQDGWQRKKYLVKSINPITIAEFLLTIYFAFGIGLGMYWHVYQMLALHIILTLGFGFVVFYSVKHSVY